MSSDYTASVRIKGEVEIELAFTHSVAMSGAERIGIAALTDKAVKTYKELVAK